MRPRHCHGSNDACLRESAEQILRGLDLCPGDVVVDVGAGRGWWEPRLAERVGRDGTVYAAEIRPHLVADMKSKFADLSQVRPYLAEADSTGLAGDTCHAALLIGVYHDLDRQTDYLRHLRDVIKRAGRLVVVDRQPGSRGRHRTHGILPSVLVRHAHEAGWVPVGYEPMGTGEHYLAVFSRGSLDGG